MRKYISSLVDTLYRASFDIELFIAEAFFPITRLKSLRHPVVTPKLPFLHREVPVRHSTISNVLPK
jgi:hypothetical protein